MCYYTLTIRVVITRTRDMFKGRRPSDTFFIWS